LNEQQAEYLNDVMSSSRHLLSLINDILDLSKVEAGKMDLEYTDIDMNRLLENSLVMIKEKAMKHRINLGLKTDIQPLTCQADERKMKQVIYNLLSNAVKFTPDGGRIEVRADVSLSDPLLSEKAGLTATDRGKRCLMVSVEDTGIGIKNDDLERIFLPFEQADGSRSRKYQGTGLGLSLTQKLVESHNGRLWAESRGEGKGSIFKFVIPCSPEEWTGVNTASRIKNIETIKGEELWERKRF
jgi:signal transduction histidine kinase